MFIAFVRFPFAENTLTWIAALLAIGALKLENGLPAESIRRRTTFGGTATTPGSPEHADA